MSAKTTPRVRCYVALGSNEGDREASLIGAASALRESEQVRLVAASRVYETEPVGPPPQGRYLNAVVELDTALAARGLIERLLEIERQLGRRRDGTRWGPRRLDLDLLLYGDARIAEPGLVVPHPHLHERAFVLEPLCDLAPRGRHPELGTEFQELARRVRNPAAVRVIELELPIRAGRHPEWRS